MFQCFHCLKNSVVWQCDYDFDDFGYEGNGIVQILTCTNCGADIEYRIEEKKGEIKENIIEGQTTIDDFIEEK